MAIFRSPAKPANAAAPPVPSPADDSDPPNTMEPESDATEPESPVIGPEGSVPESPVIGPEGSASMTDRLQARITAIEAQPHLVDSTARANRLVPDATAMADDFNEQLDMLRSQLEQAFDELDTRVSAAQARAEAAAVRADTAHARLIDIVTAIDQLADELPALVVDDFASREQLRTALAHLKARIGPL